MSVIRHCDFCDKTEKQVETLIKGLSDVFICDECLPVCVEIMVHRIPNYLAKTTEYLQKLKPKETP